MNKSLFADALRKLLLGATVFSVMLLAVFALAGPSTFAAVDGLATVTLVDQDTTNFGLDGRDILVTWDVASVTGNTSFQQYKIYIVQDGITLPNAGNLNDFTAFADNLFIINQSAYTGFQGQLSDSGNPPAAQQPLNNGNYVACVAAIGSDATKVTCSQPAALTGDIFADSNPPFVDHVPVHKASAGVNAIFNLLVKDDQTPDMFFADPNDGEAEFIKLHHGSDVSVAESVINAAQISSDLYGMTINSASVPAAGSTFEYYISVGDRTGNTRFVCANPGAQNANDCKASPFVVNVINAGSRSISGTISDSLGGVNLARVFVGGYAKASVETDVNGAYTVSGLPDNDGFDIVAYQGGYCDNKRFEVVGTANLTNVNLPLVNGNCGFQGGPGGGKPHVMFSGPPENSSSAPLDQAIRIGLDQALNSATVNDNNASDAGSKVYLTTDDGTTKIGGTVTFCANSNSPGCSGIPAMDSNVILFTPTSNLTASTFYTLVVTEGVTSVNGQSVEGNRPGGGHKISFNTGGGAFNNSQITQNFGQGGAFMPPYVQSMIPAPGITAPTNGKIILNFNDPLKTSTITSANIRLLNSQSATVSATVSYDSNTKKTITITPASALAAGNYRVQVLGAVANDSGVTMRTPDQATQPAFTSEIVIGSAGDSTAPTVYSSVQSGITNVAVNSGFFEFGASEGLDPSTVSTSNITMKRGATNVPINVNYDPGRNGVFVVPTSILAPNTVYTITFSTGITDLAGQALASASITSFTTGSSDTEGPQLNDVRCDDYSCTVRFNEGMNGKTAVDGSTEYAKSILKVANYTLKLETSPGSGIFGNDILNPNANITYEPKNFEAKITNIGLTNADFGKKFLLTVNASVADLSNNGIITTNNANQFKGKIEDSKQTFGFSSEGGMFAAPTGGFFGQGATAGGGEFKPEGFGSFTGEQFAFGQANMAYPFNNMAGQDANVFQIRFTPGIVLADEDQIVLTFPNGTGVSNAAVDDFSPFSKDMNQFGAGTIGFDTAYSTDGVAGDSATRNITVQLDVSGTPNANDPLTIDLRKITNPTVPKDPSTSGYTVSVKIKRAGEVLKSLTTMPYFINEAGSNTITIKVYANSAASPDNVAGNIFLRGGGPAGPMDKNLTLTAGKVTAADSDNIANDAGVIYSNLPNGCYYFNTEPFVTLGSDDYFGQHSPEPICVNGSESKSKNIVLNKAAVGNSLNLIVKLAGVSNFGGADVDIFCGGPNNFVVKKLSGLTTPDVAGYTVKLPGNGDWFCGVGPGMSKGASSAAPKALPGIAPPPVRMSVSGLGGQNADVTLLEQRNGTSFDGATNTLTYTFSVADKTLSGTVTDGANGLAGINITVHSQGYGAPTFTSSGNDGSFSIAVADFGTYEIGAMKDGLPPRFESFDVRPDGDDAGSDPDIFFKGKQITQGNPFILTLKKPAYYISGKVLDTSGNGIGYTPLNAIDGDGNFVAGGSSSDGSYTLFVDSGTWTITGQLPPDKTDGCGSLTKTVTVTTENKTSQNISLSSGSCYKLSGTVTIGGNTQANVPVFIEAWDSQNNRPAGGFFRPTSTNSSGVYEAKVSGSTTYRIGTWSPDFGELSITQAISAADVTNADLNSGTTGVITFAFTGGTASNEAFIEVKKANDKFSRQGKHVKGLNTNQALTVKEGSYNYFLDVFGIGSFNGTASTGDTVTINLSATTLVTISGNVKDASGNNLTGAMVTLTESGSNGLIKTVKTDSSGNYSLSVKSGTYTLTPTLSGYVPSAAPSLTAATSDTTVNFTGASALKTAGQVITGTVYKADASSPVTTGFVTASSSDGRIVAAPVDPQSGTYSLPVDNGTWTIKGVAPLHAKTTRSSTVTVLNSDAASKDITLTADNSKSSTVSSQSLAANTGGSVDDTDNTGVKFTAGAGVLESGSGNVTLIVEKTFDAPDTANYQPLGDASFGITASGSSSIKDLNGNAELIVDYSSLVASLPAGTSESDLKFGYFDPAIGDYVLVEKGFVVDTTNNLITAQTDHLTDFALLVSTGGSAPSTPSGLAATAASSSQINLSWTQTTGATGYSVFRSTSANGTFSRLGSDPTVSSGSTLTYSDTGLSASTAYFYKISAVNSGGESAASSAVSATTSSAGGSNPGGDSGGSSGGGGGGGSAASSSSSPSPTPSGSATPSPSPSPSATPISTGTAAGENAGQTVTETLKDKDKVGSGTLLPFSDSKEHWGADFIAHLYNKGIVKGYNENEFKPDKEISRAEFLKIVLMAAGVATPATVQAEEIEFVDMKADDWFATYVETAVQMGIVEGYKDKKGRKTFKPNANISRAEAVKILVVTFNLSVDALPDAGFPDVPTGSWFSPYVNRVFMDGIVSGYANGKFGPNDNLTRAQAAKIVSLLVK